ncbi:MAG: hypothetical protein MN733_38935, partial [Nitrososphaera sp.]|nr:hypothetical protein [Nitrososphaera sp.]
MAVSPAHKFGQYVGNLIEEIVGEQLAAFCNERNLYLDAFGTRGKARKGKRVSWVDDYGNIHNLDFVIEKDGSSHSIGTPVAFIEVAWRRYTKHSRNKAQEIQGALLPIRDKYRLNAPFLGVVLAGIFTEGARQQLESVGFAILYFPYQTITDAFSSVEIDTIFSESTPDSVYADCLEQIQALPTSEQSRLRASLAEANKENIRAFLAKLRQTLDRMIERIQIVPLHGTPISFSDYLTAADFVRNYDEATNASGFSKYELIVTFTNGDKVEASFGS